LETAIPKKTKNGKPAKSRPDLGGPTPPPLSEKLIAQLHGAVRAAQRKRMPPTIDKSERRSADE